jgi:hypothetical protein
MKILIVHQNFPGQYLHLARHLGAIPGNEVVFVTQRRDATLPGVRNIVYRPQRTITPNIHHYLRDTEAGVLKKKAGRWFPCLHRQHSQVVVCIGVIRPGLKNGSIKTFGVLQLACLMVGDCLSQGLL